MENPTTIAVDLSKDVFEVAVERQGRICQRKRLSRRQLVALLSEQAPSAVVMEACGTSHYWGRKAQGLGHMVRLLPPQHVARYRIGNKTDRRDVEAILEAGRRASIVAVPVKSIEQQAVCSLHRVRSALMKTRTSRLNLLRGLLREFGVTIPLGASRVLPLVSEALADGSSVPEVLHAALISVMNEIRKAGDPYLRTLLIAGARSMLLAAHRTKRPHRLQAWALEVERRRGRNRAAVAVANKLARIIWAVATRGVAFRPTPVELQSIPA